MRVVKNRKNCDSNDDLPTFMRVSDEKINNIVNKNKVRITKDSARYHRNSLVPSTRMFPPIRILTCATPDQFACSDPADADDGGMTIFDQSSTRKPQAHKKSAFLKYKTDCASSRIFRRVSVLEVKYVRAVMVVKINPMPEEIAMDA